jgi:hypothetical protein
MILRSLSRLPSQCFYKDCQPQKETKSDKLSSPKSGSIVRKGSYFRSSDSRQIARFQCLACRRTFSQASYSDCYRQKKRKLNEPIRKLLAAQGTIRGIAQHLGISRHTVKEKLIFLEKGAKGWQENFLKEYSAQSPIREIQFDEMEAFERSKCLPVSIPLIVENKTNLVLGFRVCSMPAKGHLAEISSDENPKYPSWIRPHFPYANHRKFKGRRGCVVGQGELKRGGFDPLFSLNHTAAMFRARISRLFRRTWNTTKQKERLAAHIAIYVQEHNERILSKL